MSYGRVALRAGCAVLTGPLHRHGVKGNQHTGADHRAIGIAHPQGIAPYRSRLFQTFNAALHGGARNSKLACQIRKGRTRIIG